MIKKCLGWGRNVKKIKIYFRLGRNLKKYFQQKTSEKYVDSGRNYPNLQILYQIASHCIGVK